MELLNEIPGSHSFFVQYMLQDKELRRHWFIQWLFAEAVERPVSSIRVVCRRQMFLAAAAGDIDDQLPNWHRALISVIFHHFCTTII
ncbi:MAG: hypothetical protein U5L01_07745 [Rheinheimera sp.]|nr:hypothetical protein [Rheinheimera sp.]